MRAIRSTSFAALLLAISVAAHSQDTQTVEDDAGPLEQTVPVAVEGVEPAGETSGEALALSPEDALIEEFSYFRELVEEGNFDAADASAKRVVEMAIRIHGP
ncbi:MAG: hypothetical protein WBM45_10395, partial [Woeseiaceae bacterium]